MKREEFEAKHGRLASGVVYLDLDDPANQVPREKITCGWSDSQISAKSIEDFDELINQSVLAANSLRDTLAQQNQRITDLRKIRKRKLALGGD